VSYAALSEQEKRQVTKNLVLRRKLYARNALRLISARGCPDKNRVVIVGDRPGPGAPTDPSYHHTPFYSTKHCSGWLNALLLKEGIPEERLLWLNAFDKDGNPTSAEQLTRLCPAAIVALGGNAAKWLTSAVGLRSDQFVETYHPQYWKRFRSKERYPLLDILKGMTL